MTILTIDKNIDLEKTNFSNIEELYLNLQEKLAFEVNLQEKAKRAIEIDEIELIDF